MTFLIIVAVISVLFAAYVVWGRPWMRKAEWAKPFFAAIEPVERVLWGNSETKLKARAKMALGLVLTFLTQMGTMDITPLMPLVPDAWEPIVKFSFNLLPMIITFGGWIDEKLRDDVSKPPEIVAMRTDAPEDVKIAVAKAEVATAVAVAKIKEAGAV
jgi:hypothetical protein